jgi:hypothetical protein
VAGLLVRLLPFALYAAFAPVAALVCILLQAALEAWIGRASQIAVAALLGAVGLWLVVGGLAGLLG